jgi:HD superfamily phosphodiesterase
VELFNEWLPKVVEASTTLTAHHTDHGVGHWKRVGVNAIQLARETPDVDLTVVQLFAVFHDSMRQSEYADHLHGERGYRLALALAHSIRSARTR